MTYKNTQTPDKPGFNETRPPASVVNPVESKVQPTANTWLYPDATALSFPMTMSAVAAEISRSLKFICNSNTLKSRWMPDKIMPVFEGLDVPDIKTEKGLITDFGYAVITETISRCIKGENGFKIAPETLRDEMIERYGVKPVKDSLKDSLDLLERSKAIKTNADEKRESVALARVLAIDEIETLKEALQTLNASQENDEPYELTEQEKARLLKRQLSKQIAEQEYLQKVARGEV